MISASVILVLATLLSLLYFGLCIAAMSYVKPEEKSKFWHPFIWFDPWWPYYKVKYLPSAKNQLLLGKILFPIIILVWVIWWQIK